MNVGSLFSGIGGFDYGLERAGMRVAWQCEADEFCQRALAERWPGVPCYPDVRKLTGVAVEPVDVLCGGFPCQDISLAGKGAGIDGARSGLWGEYARLVGEIRPRYVIVENVAALLARGLGRVLGDLAALGYDAEWDCLPASAFGAPHQRDRLWLVAYPKSFGGTDGPGCAAGEALGGTVVGAGGRVVDGDSAEGVRLVGSGASGRDGRGEAVADPEREGELQPQGIERQERGRIGNGREPGDVADTERSGRSGRPQDAGRGSALREAQERCEGSSVAEGRGATGGDSGLADTNGSTRPGARSAAEAVSRPCQVERSGRCGGADGEFQDADECAVQPWRIGGRAAQAGGSEWWAAEPPVGRVAHGVPDRLAQLAAYGNALVPQIAEWLGAQILDYERGRRAA